MKPGPPKGYRKYSPYRGKRRRLLEVLINPDNDRLNEKQICEIAEVSKTSMWKYKREPDFQKAIDDLTARFYKICKPQVVNRVIKQAKQGDIKSQRTLLELEGSLRTGGNQTVNVATQVTPAEELQATTSQELAVILSEKIQELQAMLAQVQGKRIEIDTTTSMVGHEENNINKKD